MIVLTQVVLGSLLQIYLLVTGLLVTAIVLLLPHGILGSLRRYTVRASASEPMPGLRPLPPPSPTTQDTPVLSLHGVSVQFRGLRALSDVTLAVPAACIFSIIGPNGAGKSTLFNVVTAYLRPSSGEVRYRGTRIDDTSTLSLSRNGIARAFQIARPFQGMTVFDNVMVGALFGKAGPGDVRAVTEAALHITGLAELPRRVCFGPAYRAPAAAGTRARHRHKARPDPCRRTLRGPQCNGDTRRRANPARCTRARHNGRAGRTRHGDDHADFRPGLRNLRRQQDLRRTPAEVVEDERVIEAYLGTPTTKPAMAAMPVAS